MKSIPETVLTDITPRIKKEFDSIKKEAEVSFLSKLSSEEGKKFAESSRKEQGDSYFKEAILVCHDKIDKAIASLAVEMETNENGQASAIAILNVGIVAMRAEGDRERLMRELNEFSSALEEHQKEINRLFETFNSLLNSDKIANLRTLISLMNKPENQAFLKELSNS